MTRPKLCPRCGDSYDEAVDFCAKDGTRLIRGGQSADLVGTVLAERYRIVQRIGEGGMGQVYLGEHVRMRRKSAIKIMRPALVHEPEALQRFTREAENASQLSHPNIAAIFDFGDADGVVYLAMEYVDGGSLADALERDGALHPEVAADVIGQAADALQVAHDMSMLHRDIKPDNIMLGRRADGTYLVKLVDFGIARTYGDGDQKVTRTGYAVGTPQYMSPEQLAGESLDARSDQYSLALVAFYALTGQQAFPSESTKESLIMRLTSRPQTLHDARRDIDWPEALQAVFDQALAPEPVERFASVLEFAEAFSRAINSMTPTQTSELYRRALDARAASVVARTPGAAAGLATGSGERAVVSRSGSGEAVRTPGSSGSLPPSPAARWPFIIGGVVTVSVAATLYAVSGGGSASRTDTTTTTAGDSSTTAMVAVTPVDSVRSATANGGGTTAATESATTGSTTQSAASRASSPNVAPAAGAIAKATGDSLRRLRNDSAVAAAAKRKATADSIAEATAARARYPEAPARAMIQRGIDARAHAARNDDIRAVIMPTPMFVWRAEQAQAWKSTHVKPEGGAFDVADPIEHWSQWSRLVSARRAVYVLEVTPDRAPWPEIDPTRVVDFKRGDIVSVELWRDGAPVALEQAAPLVAVADETRQQSGGKPVFHSFVAVLPPTTFIPRDDGAMPKFELRVKDATRPGSTIRIGLSESLVKRLYNEFAPWRDALAR